MDFNWTEIAVLLLLAIIVFGPDKLPELARKTARVIAYLRKVGNDARGQLRDELGPEFDNLQLSDLNPKAFVARHLLDESDRAELESVKEELASARDAFKGSVSSESGATSASLIEEAAQPVPDGDDATDPEFLRAIAWDPEAT